MSELSSDADLRRVLAEARTIAVLGAHAELGRPAHTIPSYLHGHGYRILPVNATLVGTEIWGEPVRASLAELTEPVDIVEVFRKPQSLPAHLPEIFAMSPPPGVVWLQPGARHADFAKQLLEKGIDVVQDRCAMVEHRRLIGER